MEAKAMKIKWQSKEVVEGDSTWEKQLPMRKPYNISEHSTVRTKRRLLQLRFRTLGDMWSGEAIVKDCGQN